MPCRTVITPKLRNSWLPATASSGQKGCNAPYAYFHSAQGLLPYFPFPPLCGSGNYKIHKGNCHDDNQLMKLMAICIGSSISLYMAVDGNNAIPRSAVKARKCDPPLQK